MVRQWARPRAFCSAPCSALAPHSSLPFPPPPPPLPPPPPPLPPAAAAAAVPPPIPRVSSSASTHAQYTYLGFG
jgi:hypothetical protein